MKSGIILLHKQPGMTSFDCIRDLKRSLKRTDLGHGGTLDKFASGVLPVLAGEGLKLARFFLESFPTLPTYWKTYRGLLELGTSTETGDPEGAVIETLPVPELTVDQISEAMKTFMVGTYHQTPPKYSAKKIGGERASDLAREGKTVELKAVPVTIKRLECLALDGKYIRFEAECSKGTYIRVLAEDLARKLGTVAHLRELQRTAVGSFTLSDTTTLEHLKEAGNEAIQDLRFATSFLEPFTLIGHEPEQLRVGKVDDVLARLANSGLKPTIYCAQTKHQNNLIPVALLELTADKTGKFLRAFTY